jgi:hypothetical protein
LIATLCLSFAYCNIINDAIDAGFYLGFKSYLEIKYPGEEKLIGCIIGYFKFFKLEKKFVNLKTLINFDEASDDIQFHVNISEGVCRIKEFALTPIGIFCDILVFVVCAVVVCCSWCCSSKYLFFLANNFF